MTLSGITMLDCIPDDRVVSLAATQACYFESVTNLDTFDRLNAHDSLCEQCINLAIPMNMTSETDGNSVRNHFDDSAERVTFASCALDCSDHCFFGCRVETTHFRGIDCCKVGHERQ